MPQLPALRSIIDVLARYRRLALEELYDVAVEIEDPTLDIPRVGYTAQYRHEDGSRPVWEPVLEDHPWDWSIHSLRYLCDLADAKDGYVHIDVRYVTVVEAREASRGGLPPEPFADSFRLMVWPVFAVEYKSSRWKDLRDPLAPSKTTAELFNDAGRFVHGPVGVA